MFRHHRQRFLDRLSEEKASAVLLSGSPRVRNHDSEYRFRPHSDFYYLTGFREPEAALVLVPHGSDDGGARSVLFLRERNPAEEVWTGRRLGVEAAPETLDVDAAFPIEELWERLPQLLRGAQRVVYRTGEDEERDRDFTEVLARMRRRVRNGDAGPTAVVDPSSWLHEERLVKTPAELEVLGRAAALSAEAHVLAMGEAAPGGNERELDALLDYTFRRRGGTGSAYTNIVAGGPNACILHYTENDQPLCDGDLLLIDAGAEWDHYASDVTRTFPVNGRFSPEQRALYEVVLNAQKAAIEATRPGVRFVAVHETAVAAICSGLSELGILKGSAEELVETEAYRKLFMHRTGHWLGLDVHDCGAYYLEGESRPLEAGMVMTVEPGLYVAPDDETVEPRWRGIGIRIEDDVVITPDGSRVLTEAIPKEVEEVEAACRRGELQPVA